MDKRKNFILAVAGGMVSAAQAANLKERGITIISADELPDNPRYIEPETHFIQPNQFIYDYPLHGLKISKHRKMKSKDISKGRKKNKIAKQSRKRNRK